jgi:dihydroxyacid dehydratase/phosphogluconate dehydratase
MGDCRAARAACASAMSLQKLQQAGQSRPSAMIYINANTCQIELRVSEDEIHRRPEEPPPFEPKVKRGWLARYRLHVTSADTGAAFES